MIKEAIFLYRNTNYSQHRHTLEKEEEKQTQFMESSYTELPGTTKERKTSTTSHCHSVFWHTSVSHSL